MKKTILFLASVLLLAGCVVPQFPTSSTLSEPSASSTQTQSLIDPTGVFSIVVPGDYTYNNETNIDSALSYGAERRETYMLALAESKSDIEAKNLDEYFTLVTPGLENRTIEELSSGTISNPENYTVKDYKIEGSYTNVKIVWYMRLIDTKNSFIQINTWTLPSKEEKNKAELFSNISSVRLK